MIDQELKTHLESIEKELVYFRKMSIGPSSVFLRGIFHGAGYVVGAAFVIVVIGWVLNIIGIIPALGDQVTEFREALDRFTGTR